MNLHCRTIDFFFFFLRFTFSLICQICLNTILVASSILQKISGRNTGRKGSTPPPQMSPLLPKPSLGQIQEFKLQELFLFILGLIMNLYIQKTKQATEIIPVLIPKLPLSGTTNQFIDSLSSYMTNSA